jgi:tyrosine recombinase XerC/tyrosine recombinase XerD
MLAAHGVDFLTHMRVEKSASNLTLISYKTDLAQFFDFLAEHCQVDKEAIPVESLSYTAVREYISRMQKQKLSRSTMARKLAALRSFVKYLCRENILEGNPIANISTPKQEKKLPRFLYPLETSLLMEAPDTGKVAGLRDKAILETLYAAGVRVSELVGINIPDLELGERWIKIRGKGGKERLAPLGEQALRALNIYLQKGRPYLAAASDTATDALFLNKSGSRLSVRSIRNIINKYVDQLAINQKVSPHTLRHSFATHMLNGGADLRSVQELLGHVKLSTTQIYTHLTKDRIKTIHEETHPRR